MFEVSVSAAFEAAHTLDVPGAAEGYRVIHGHSFLVTATAGAESPGPSGWVIDLGAFEQTLKDVLAPLDHSLLNDVPGLEKPTFESLLVWIDEKLQQRGIRPTRIEIERPILRQRAVYTPNR
jgi:6-pyruvoyltetrahydropterin/6-carboxytetrahydropterin synthase